MRSGQETEQDEKHQRAAEAGIVVPDRVAGARGQVPVRIWREGLDAGRQDQRDGLVGHRYVRASEPRDGDVLLREEVYWRGRGGWCACDGPCRRRLSYCML